MTEQLWERTQQAETNLQADLKDKEATLPNILHFLAQYRFACEDTIFQDFEFAVGKDVENRLWDFHGRINNRFRKELKNFQDTAGRKKPVERRKLVKDCLDFIKSSQRFYRGYVQRLAARFDGIPALEAVAKRLTLSTLSADEPSQVSGSLGQSILLSCHQTLVRLGDLSRWRETQLETKDRNWGPAIGYYDLARAVYPASGASHNQMAVIALVDLDHLRAMYYLYRALASEEPYPTAKGNLEIEFKKIEDAWSKGEMIQNDLGPFQDQAPGKALVGWYVRLHARCYKGVEFPEHEELESEVLSQLTVDLKERSLEGIFSNFILINIAAGYFAGVRLQGDAGSAENLQSFFFIMRLNVKSFFTLLQVLSPELERSVINIGSNSGSVKLTAVTRRLLPGLRHYSSWLVANAVILASQVGDTLLHVQIKEFWKIYVNTLTLLASTFPATELPLIEYLLPEDEDTLDFKPFDHDELKQRYFSEDMNSQKPKWHDQGVQRHHPNVEMYGRVRDLLTDGTLLHSRENVPIQLVGESFIYVEEDVPSDVGYQISQSTTSTGRDEITHIDETALPAAAPSLDGGASQAPSMPLSMDLDSKRMVDDLVGSETTDEHGDVDGTALANAALQNLANPGSGFSQPKEVGNDTSYGLIGPGTAREHFGDLQNPPPVSPRPLLPSIDKSPFALQPGEETPGSRPGTAKRTTPSHSQHNSQTQFPLQQITHAFSVDPSTASTMSDPTQPNPNPHLNGVYHNQPLINSTFPTATNYTSGGRIPITYPNGTFDESGFRSSDITSYGASGTVRASTSFQTPPNGQDAG